MSFDSIDSINYINYYLLLKENLSKLKFTQKGNVIVSSDSESIDVFVKSSLIKISAIIKNRMNNREKLLEINQNVGIIDFWSSNEKIKSTEPESSDQKVGEYLDKET